MFHALADATRRDIVAVVLAQEQSVSELARRYPMSFAAVQKHVAVLDPPEADGGEPVSAVAILRGFNAPSGVAHST